MTDGKWSGRRVFGVLVATTVAGFLAWLAISYLVWTLLAAGGGRTDFWTVLQGLSTAAALATVLVGAFFAYGELSEASRGRYMEVADRLFEELNSQASIEARRWVFQHLPPDPAQGIPTLPPHGHDAVKRVLNSLDRLAFLTQPGWIPDDMVMPWMTPMIVKAWRKLEPYVDYESQRRGEPDYYAQARKLAVRCLAWRAAHVPGGDTVTWLDDAI